MRLLALPPVRLDGDNSSPHCLGLMPSDSGNTTSVWMETADVPSFPPLARDATADVCIIGAGIAGLTTAYLCLKSGKSVVVLDDGPIGGGETGRTTAHLTCALDDFYHEIETMHGAEGARIAAESHASAIDRVESIVTTEHIDCDFKRVDGYYFLGGDDTVDVLDDELAASRRAGIADAMRVERIPGVPFNSGPALKFPRQAQFHILKYLAGLARAIERDGGRIFCGSHVSEVKAGKPGRVGTDAGQTVKAEHLVVCTNSPINNWVAVHNKQASYRTYAIGALVPAGSIQPGLYWDTLEPYHYVRLLNADASPAKGGSDVLIVGGEDHKTGQKDDADERFRRLETWTRERFPMVQTVDYRWSGQVIEPVDYMAYIGRNPGNDPNIYIATGDSGNGITHGTIAGMLITDLVMGRENLWQKLYDPSRISLRAAPAYVKENLNFVAQYRDYVTPGEVTSPDQIAPGEGALIRDGAKKIACYKDEQGDLHLRSAVCPHLFCIVDWNHAEKSWDCPCHGSRFDRYGRVVNGPASSDLKPLEE
ncbi:MAG: FAD-dependent oxidoreductase [Gemmatimonadaceae bacterium]